MSVTETPRHRASEIVGEDPLRWVVNCEGGCGRTLSVPKAITRDGQDIQFTAPGARRCMVCGPFSGDLATV